MPKFVDSTYSYETVTSNAGIDVYASKSDINDLLLITAIADNSAATVNTFSANPPTGWAILEEYYNYTPAIVYMKISDGNQADVTLTSSQCLVNETYSASMNTIRDVNTTSPVGSSTIDSYPESNQDSVFSIGTTSSPISATGVGQSFVTPAATANARNVGCFSRVKLYLKKVGNPTGTATIYIGSHNGVYGTSSTTWSAGSALVATTLDVSTLTTTLAVNTFVFPTWFQFTANTNYVVAIEYSGGDVDNYIQVGYDASTPSHSGNMTKTSGINNWQALASYDMCFYVDRYTYNLQSVTGAARNTAPTITTDRDNCLILYLRTCSNQPQIPSFIEGPVCREVAAESTVSSGEGIGIGWTFQETAGATPNNVVCSLITTANSNGIFGVCQINPPTSGATIIPAFVSVDNCNLIDYIHGSTGFAGNTGLAATADTNYGTTLGSFTAIDASVTAQADYGLNSYRSMGAIANNTVPNRMSGAEVVIAEANRFNMTGKNLLCHIMHLTPLHTQRHPTIQTGRGFWFGVRSDTASGGATTGYKIWQVHGIGTPWNLTGHIPVIINAGNTTGLTASSGTLDEAVITSVGFWNSGVAQLTNTMLVGVVWLMDSTIVCGGNATHPITVDKLIPILAKGKERISAIQQGSRQLLLLQSVQLGNGGTNSCYVDFSKSAIEFPSLYDATSGLVNYCSVANEIGFHFYPGAGQVVDLRSTVISSASKFFFTFDALSSTSADVRTDGFTLINAGTTYWKAGITYSGMSLSSCDGIAANGATFTGCTFSDATSVNAITINSVAECNLIDECTFTNNNRAIKITAAGEYNFDGHYFEGNTYDVENASTGAVTINNLNQSNAATAINTAGGTTSFVTAVTVTIKCIDENNNNLEGIVVYVENASTKAQILSSSTNASGIATVSFNYPGSDVSINIRLRKASAGSTKYVPIKTTGTITNTGFSLTATLYVDPIAAP